MASMELQKTAQLLPERLREWVLGEATRRDLMVEEIRLRTGKRMAFTAAGKAFSSETAPVVSGEHIALVVEAATRASLHSSAESLRQGYITAVNGSRIGVCGTGVIRGGELAALRDISALNLRIAREMRGVAGDIPEKLQKDGGICNTLIVSPPGAGKTTLLREIVRVMSERGTACGVVDERGEIAAMHGGICGFDVGGNTDVQNGIDKATAAMLLLRTMSPQLIALDEISEARDAYAAELAANCGVSLLATVHGASIADIRARPVLTDIMKRGIFSRAITIRLENGTRRMKIEEIGA